MSQKRASVSFWTQRRRINCAIDTFMQDIENVESVAAGNSDEVGESACQTLSGSYDCDVAEGPSFPTVEAEGFSALDCSIIGRVADGEQFDPAIQSVMNRIDLDDFNDVGGFSDPEDEDDQCVSDIDLKGDLAQWATTCNVPLSTVDSLLRVLHVYHPALPLDARTVLKTPRYSPVRDLPGGGQYILLELSWVWQISMHLGT